MILFVLLLSLFATPAHAQEAKGEDTSGMRITRDTSPEGRAPTKYVPSVALPEERSTKDALPLTPAAPPADPLVTPPNSMNLYIDSSRLLTLSILNKQTAKTEQKEINEGGNITSGSLTIQLVECWRSAPEAKPESAALLRIFENSSRSSYFGWMYASSPSLNPFEHASYDITIKECR